MTERSEVTELLEIREHLARADKLRTRRDALVLGLVEEGRFSQRGAADLAGMSRDQVRYLLERQAQAPQ